MLIMKCILLFLCFLNANSLKVGNRVFVKKQIQEIGKFISSYEVQKIYNIKYNSVKDYLIDLETLKFIFKSKKIQINEQFLQHVLAQLPQPNTQTAIDFATYITLFQQMHHSVDYNKNDISSEHVKKAKNEIIYGYKLWIISNPTKNKSQMILKKLEESPSENHKNILKSSETFIENQDIILDFQLSELSSNTLKETLKGKFSKIVYENGHYVFYFLENRVIVDENLYEKMQEKILKDNSVKKYIQMSRSHIYSEES